MTERCKDWAWTINRNADRSFSHDAAQLAVLMDIRDELKRLNQHLSCPNATDIPHILRAIRANTANLPKQPRRKKP